MFIIRTKEEYEDIKKNIKKGIEIMRLRKKNNLSLISGEATFLNKITLGHIKEFRQQLRRYKKEYLEDDDEPKVDPDLIQYWPGLFTNNDF